MPPVWDLWYWLAAGRFWLPGILPVRKAQPWPHIKLKMKGWEGCDGRERPGFVSLNGEVMRRTKVVSSKPAGMQLTRTKRSARVGLHPDAALFQHGSRSSSAFHFICTTAFMSEYQADMCLSHRAAVWLTSILPSIYLSVDTLGSGLGSWSSRPTVTLYCSVTILAVLRDTFDLICSIV